jgi:transposase
VEQRYQAVLAVVQDGWKVTEVAERLGVSRQSVHAWIARYEQGGLASLADRSHRPQTCPHQTDPELEAAICELRREHPGWGPRRIGHQLARSGLEPVPSRSAIYRCLRRHRLIELRRRRRRRDEFRRWERERPMQLWQMDVMGGIELEDGSEAKIVTGIDDHSRFCVAAGLVLRATSKAVCEVLAAALSSGASAITPHDPIRGYPHTAEAPARLGSYDEWSASAVRESNSLRTRPCTRLLRARTPLTVFVPFVRFCPGAPRPAVSQVAASARQPSPARCERRQPSPAPTRGLVGDPEPL